MSAAVRKEIEAFTRQLLRDRLAQCTPAQRGVHYRVYGAGPDDIPEKQLIDAIDLCDRTIRKNLADPCRLNSNPVPVESWRLDE
jgi:hypothetical protein